MVSAKLGSVRVLGVGHLGVAVASFFNGDTLTSGMDYDPESVRDFKVDNVLLMKEFEGSSGSRIEKILKSEKETVIDNFSCDLIFIVAQIDGRFQEVVIPPLLKILRSTGAFVGFFPIIPIGADPQKHLGRIQKIRTDLDMLEFVDSEYVLSGSKSRRIVEINNGYYKHVWEKVLSVSKVVDNSTALGVSLHDIKMLSNLYGPVRVSSFTYPFVNFSIAERDLSEEVSKLPKERIKRIYMVLEIGSEVDSTDVIAFVRRIKNRLDNLDFRQGFIHTQGDFGLILLSFGSF